MEVMNLATKEKQDEILSHFPVSGGTDFLDGTPTVLTSNNNSKADISGKGILTSIVNHDTSDITQSENKIYADGELVDIIRINGKSTILTLIPFNTSLSVSTYRMSSAFIILF